MSYKTVSLKKGKEINLQRKHPWIFSGALYRPDKSIADGAIVKVSDYKGNILGVGHYNSASIAIRIISFEDKIIDSTFYNIQFNRAFSLRKNILNLPNSETNCFRLIAGEGDELPGLIIDIYNKTAVIQSHSKGMLNQIQEIAIALDNINDLQLDTIFLKSIHIKGNEYEDQFLKGNLEEDVVLENGRKFLVNWKSGQKTGFFLDQRVNRNLLSSYSKNRTVLNTFCYTGGFSVYAATAGATLVDSIDISELAMNLTDKNIELNEVTKNHNSITGNVMEYLKTIPKDKYDLIVLDPPAFAKSRNKSHNAVQAYKRLNLSAMQKIKSGGIIFTFSCSQVIGRELFENTIRAAAIESDRNIKILKHLNQSPDHSINIFHQEGHYLKGLILYVE